MAPNASVSIDASKHVAEPTAIDAGVGSSSISHNDGVQEPGPSSAAGLPPYSGNPSLDDPFRDGDAHVGYFYPNGNGMQKGLKSATATQMDPPPVPIANIDPFASAMDLDESLPLPLPPRPSGLSRGLQIPSRVSLITWGFSFPEILAEQGVSKSQWRSFKHQLEDFARLSFTQVMTVFGSELLMHHVLGPIPAGIVSWKMSKHRQHKNFQLAYQSGQFTMFEDRWNNDYFHSLGLHVRIEPPGVGKMDGMDVASTKLFRYQQKMGTRSPAPGVASKQGDKKEYKYQYREGRDRMKAAHKGRIIVLPFKSVDVLPLQPRTTDPESNNGQSQGVTAGPCIQDSACFGRQSDVKDLHNFYPTVQRLASS